MAVETSKLKAQRSTPPADYAKHGLGPLPNDSDGRALYLDLMKRAVANILYEDVPSWIFDRTSRKITAGDRFRLDKRVTGEDGPTAAHTMIGLKRLDNIQHCLEEVLSSGVPGDVIEAGVLAGGATIFMRAILKAHGDTTRRVFVCDSFVAQPTAAPPKFVQWTLKAAASIDDRDWQRNFFRVLQSINPAKAVPDVKDPSDELVGYTMQVLQNGDRMAVPTRDTSLAGVRSNFARYGLLDDQVVIVKGYFSETLPGLDAEAFSLIRLDGDLYESTMDCLENLYPKLSSGGFCIIDDYHELPDCRRAVEEYRSRQGIEDRIEAIDYHGVYWRKS
ncbi:MAG TPA: TylF/MycF/NovP-related O-methyltransferase [Acidobacteriaceae bacterium]|jgi:hypothetical protein|nr:TylF/MycF/NovP-related O-methyltransferase [Acidobacteriaceae bacterium]